MAICSFVRVLPVSARSRVLRPLTLACLLLASAPLVRAADLTWAPAGDPLASNTWDATDGNWLDSTGQVNWDQTATGVFAGAASVFPVYNAPIQAGLRVDGAAVAAPAFGYTAGAAPSALSNSQNLQFYAGLDPTSGTTAPTYSLGMVSNPTLDTGTNGDLTTVVTTLLQGSGGFTKTGAGNLQLRNPFSTFEGNIVISQGLVNTQSSPPQTTTFGSQTAYDYFNQLNAYSGTGALASEPQPSTFGRADIPRTVTIAAGAGLYLQGVDAFGGSAGPAPQITLNIESGARLWTDFIGGYSSTYGGIDPARPSGGQRGPVTSMGAINLTSGSMNGAWSWNGASGTSTQIQPISTGSQAWLLRGTVTSSGSATMNSSLLSRGYHGGMHLYDTPFVVTDGTLNVPGQFFNPASASANTPSGLTKSGGGTMVISGHNWHSGTTSVIEGTLRVEGRKNPLKVSTALVSGSTAKMEINSDQTMPYLRVLRGTAALPTQTFVTVNTSTLSVNSGSGGLLDVGSGRVNWSAGMTATTLVDRLVSGRNGGAWDGAVGITSREAAASGGTRAVGWVDNGGGSLSVSFAAPGDTNIDGAVDVLDASNLVASGKYGTGDPATWSEGDFNYDGVVDVLDAADFASTGLYNEPSYFSAAAPAPPAKVEQFTTNPGWTNFRENASNPEQTWGYQASSPMGTGGAIGGTMYKYGRSSDRIGSYLADTTTFSGSNGLQYTDTFSAKGNLYINNSGALNDAGFGIGFFNWEQANGVTADGTIGVSGTTVGTTATSFVGVRLNSLATQGTNAFQSRLYAQQNNRETSEYNYSYATGSVSTAGTTNSSAVVQGSIVPFAFQFTPGLNGSGILSGTINGQSVNVSVATRTYYGPWMLDAFGIVTGLQGSAVSTAATAEIYLDNLVYGYGSLDSLPALPSAGGIAAVPEPAAWQALVAAAGAAGLAVRLRRRRL